MKPEDKIVQIIVVNYFNDEELLHFVKNEIGVQDYKELKLLVVNNGSNNIEKLRYEIQQFPFAELIDAYENKGYLGAIGYGLQRIKDQGREWPNYLIISNTDIKIGRKDFFSKLVMQFENLDFAVAGPSVISNRFKRHPQNPFMTDRISSGRLKFLKFIFSNYMTYLVYQTLAVLKAGFRSYKPAMSKEMQEVYAVHGSFMILKSSFIKTVFERINDFPFLFGEEIFLSELARQKGMKILYNPILEVEHLEHTSTGLFKSRVLQRHMHSALQLLSDKFFNHGHS